MSGDGDLPHRPASPSNAEENVAKRDKYFRRYASAVERALSSFDTNLQNWADYISFLGRLLKVNEFVPYSVHALIKAQALQTKPPEIHEIPYSRLVAKRLSQCLDPALPSVHGKAIEVYGVVFSTLGNHGLSTQLSLFLPGLAPVLSYASLTVKPLLLSLFESYVVTLDVKALKPALKAVIMSLLPGLEEAASEEFDRTYNMLDKLRKVLANERFADSNQHTSPDDRYFWQSFFMASISNVSRRPGALAYLERNLPRLTADGSTKTDDGEMCQRDQNGSPSHLVPSIDAVTSPEPGLLIRCFAAGLQDDQLLIQRGFLELLVTHLPLNSVILQQHVSVLDLELLVAAATSVVVRREMSLNRRLWLWFLGSAASPDTERSELNSPHTEGSPVKQEANKGSPVQHFEKYGLKPLVQGLLKGFDARAQSPSARARPFRICLSLMDRWEIGGVVMPLVFRPAMASVQSYEPLAPSKDVFTEVFRSASAFFDAIQSSLIWKEIILLLFEALDGSPQEEKKPQEDAAEAQLELVWFVITRFNIGEEEMLSIHVPNALLLILHYARDLMQSKNAMDQKRNISTLEVLMKIALHLLDHVPERALVKRKSTTSLEPGLTDSARPNGEVFFPQSLRDHYHNASHPQSDITVPVAASKLKPLLFSQSKELIVASLGNSTIHTQLSNTLSLAANLCTKARASQEYDSETLLFRIASLMDDPKATVIPNFQAILGQIATLEFVQSIMDPGLWHADPQVRQVITCLVRSVWKHLSPVRPRHNVEAIRCLWRLHKLSPDDHMLEAAITSFLHLDENGLACRKVTAEALGQFTMLWTHSATMSRLSSARHQSLSPTEAVTPISPVTPGSAKRASEGLASLTRPLFLVLDTLRQPASELYPLTSSWLKSLSNINVILDLLVQRLYACPYFTRAGVLAVKPSESIIGGAAPMADHSEEGLYAIETLLNILTAGSTYASSGLRSQSMLTHSIDDDPILRPLQDSDDFNAKDAKVNFKIQEHILHLCTIVLSKALSRQSEHGIDGKALRHFCVRLLRQVIANLEVDSAILLHLEGFLINVLSWSVEKAETGLQRSLMEAVKAILEKRSSLTHAEQVLDIPSTSSELRRDIPQVPPSNDAPEKPSSIERSAGADPTLLECLMLGLKSVQSYSVLEQWVDFLEYILPYYASNIFQIIIPLVDSVTTSITSLFEGLETSFREQSTITYTASEPIQSVNHLFNALEHVLAKGHDQITRDEAKKLKLPEPSQGYFGHMVTGLFSGEVQASRPVTANDRLSVLLCFRDAVKISYKIWAWEADTGKLLSSDTATAASFSFMSIRLRNRTRRVLEHLFAAEPLECFEVLAELWRTSDANATTVMDLLHTLEATRPKNIMPTIFHALYSRTNPSVLDAFRQSTLTSELSDVQLAAFLISYTRSMDDDALDEIWTDCMTFCRDVLANPMPQRQILPLMIEFIAVIGGKIDNTNFGEQRRMRREISDLFVRLLAAMFTIRPLSFSNDTVPPALDAVTPKDVAEQERKGNADISTDIVSILSRILPSMVKTLIDTDRISSAASTISLQILMPTFHWKGFPHNVTPAILKVLQTLSRITEISARSKKDVAEAFNDPRFFSTRSLALVETGWMPMLRQWALADKERMPEILSRLSAPTSAGIMFGVGASSARLEADRKAQVNLRRIALLVLSADDDRFVSNVKLMQEKLTELLNATASSSPSSATRAEIYIVFRTLALKTSPVHLMSLWPILNSELHDALASIGRIASRETYNITSILQAAKLLDTLLLLGPDDFQLREWLYITDTIDAVYRPHEWRPVALVDELVEILDNEASAAHSATPHLITDASRSGRVPLLRWEDTHMVPREKMLDQVLRPFLRQLSINVFEYMYQMEPPDKKECCEEVLKDLFDDSTLV